MTTNKPKISIITVNYNNADGLRETIRSVTEQSYAAIEYIVVDGASTDGGVDVLESFRPNLAHAISEKDTGIYNAMNKGIKLATGDYLLFLNSGDKLISPQIIEEVVAQGLHADLVYGDLKFFDDAKEWTWNLPDELTFRFFYDSTLPHPSTFISRELFDTVGLYDEELKIVSDWKFFMLAVAKHNCSYQHIGQMISAYNFDGISSKPENGQAIQVERSKVLAETFPLFLADYEELDRLKKELKKIKYFMKVRKAVKKIFNSK
ncbi:glycosyltransferase family 2 protein [Pedobacter sp. KR3-3]|uniref:Glycosyltransferase family 2 protein n=1 Tax=Pedobacter albus TaxID=3113905 RepID=A0ABU7I9V7_9SPHI|nr:glycosyltransferase family 2 protein [Pedobacter sp. KR3-3]MEE1946255.1 glycosyltransferase family 2 protein [Pedobacter sp. KR3-3]